MFRKERKQRTNRSLLSELSFPSLSVSSLDARETLPCGDCPRKTPLGHPSIWVYAGISPFILRKSWETHVKPPPIQACVVRGWFTPTVEKPARYRTVGATWGQSCHWKGMVRLSIMTPPLPACWILCRQSLWGLSCTIPLPVRLPRVSRR